MSAFMIALGIAAGLAAAAFFAVCEGALYAVAAPDAADTEPPGVPLDRFVQSPEAVQHAISVGHMAAVIWVGALAWAGVTALSNGPLTWLAGAMVAGFVTLVVAELVPKSLGMEHPVRWARLTRPALAAWVALLSPLTSLLVGVTHRFSRSLDPSRETPLSSQEVRTLIAETSERAELEYGERQMITSIFSFGETTVREVMTPRPDIFAVDLETSWDDLVPAVAAAEHSRIPVYEKSLDTVAGVLYAKDLLSIVHGLEIRPETLMSLLAEPHFVPEAKKIDDLLREFQRDRFHLAFVVDEYGGTAGIVTLEDILEELVGEIQDEYDREEPLVEPMVDGSLLLAGGLDFDDFNDLTGSHLDRDGVETIGGLVAVELGRVAEGGERVEIGGWCFEVTAVDGNRIVKVRATLTPVTVDDESVEEA